MTISASAGTIRGTLIAGATRGRSPRRSPAKLSSERFSGKGMTAASIVAGGAGNIVAGGAGNLIANDGASMRSVMANTFR